MVKYTEVELDEGIRALASTLSKCEKVFEKLMEGTPQHTLTSRRIKALKIAIDLIEEKAKELKV